MKWKLLILVLAIAVIVLGSLLFQKCSETKPVDNSARIASLEADSAKAGKQIRSLEIIVDSLLKVPPEIQRRVIKITDTIDVRIKKDSSYSIVALRDGLQKWGTIPDGTDYPTYREFGYSAKYMQEGYGFKLQVKEYKEKIVPTLQSDIESYKVLRKGDKELLEIKDLTISDQATQIKDGNAWYHNDILWAGVGGGVVAVLFFLLK